MIVEPDFLDHWKTRLLVDLLQDERAPLCLLRLWAHAQQRKRDTFEGMTPEILKAVCRFDGDAQALFDAMLRCGWIEATGEAVLVCGFRETNTPLFAAWDNGRKGGRPPKKNPGATQRKPMGYPGAAQAEPIEEEKSREDKPQSAAHSVCTEPASPTSMPATTEQAIIEFDCVGKGPHAFAVTRSLVNEYSEAFPSIDVASELLKARAWIRADPSRRKTAAGMKRFLVGWLNRATDRSPPSNGRHPPPGESRNAAAIAEYLKGN